MAILLWSDMINYNVYKYVSIYTYLYNTHIYRENYVHHVNLFTLGIPCLT